MLVTLIIYNLPDLSRLPAKLAIKKPPLGDFRTVTPQPLNFLGGVVIFMENLLRENINGVGNERRGENIN